jgi:hypothetical protein
LIAALVGAALRPDSRRGGLVEGTAVATVFWAIALTGTWATGTTSSPDAGSLVVGLPAVGVTTVLVSLLLRDDDVTSGQGAVALLCTIVLGLALAISGVQVHDDRERAVFTATAARQLESLGIQPLLPELDGCSLAEFSQHRGETSDLLDLDGYSLTFEDGDGQDLQIGIGAADEAPCRDGDEDCRDEGTFTVEDRGDARIVTVDRGRTRLHAWLDAGNKRPRRARSRRLSLPPSSSTGRPCCATSEAGRRANETARPPRGGRAVSTSEARQRSMIATTPCPPAAQTEISARPPPLALSSLAVLATIRPPVAENG